MFAFNYILLALSGIWPPEGLPPALLGVYVVLSTVAHAFFFYSCGAYTVGFLNCDDVDLAMGAACDVLVVYLTCYKIFVLLKNKRVINGLVYSLRHELNVSYAPLQRACRDHEEAVNNLASKVTGRYYLVLLSVDATYIFMYFRAELRGQVRIPMWDPFGARVSTGLPFLLYSCVPVSAALMSGIHTTVFDTMILTFSLLLGAKIDNLTRLLVTLEEDTGPRPAAEVRAERQRRLREAVIIHQKIIRYRFACHARPAALHGRGHPHDQLSAVAAAAALDPVLERGEHRHQEQAPGRGGGALPLGGRRPRLPRQHADADAASAAAAGAHRLQDGPAQLLDLRRYCQELVLPVHVHAAHAVEKS
ncbi:uncharacterized protein LOC113211051 isoform X2 [Frankliniella occidentalis]|uniref:Odorant receptor n=1 Tax=Frankliniella occidentalis TaxID=133901 RepID=A0A6J1T338_FRAOC|nr:uncharacterized protein LOC113211051 isoform X2 [Frankliniella occidentalis]